MTAIEAEAGLPDKETAYREVQSRIESLCDGETDSISLMATISCELYQAFDEFHWVGFYRNVGNDTLKIGPYQGGHGCLVIPFARGVCGAAARTRKIQNVPDVLAVADHIACSATTRSEIVLPVLLGGELLGVLDIDSDLPACFDAVDEQYLQAILRVFEGCD